MGFSFRGVIDSPTSRGTLQRGEDRERTNHKKLKKTGTQKEERRLKK
jgi:hypothetical protein